MARTKTNTQNDTQTLTTSLRNRYLETAVSLFERQSTIHKIRDIPA